MNVVLRLFVCLFSKKSVWKKIVPDDAFTSNLIFLPVLIYFIILTKHGLLSINPHPFSLMACVLYSIELSPIHKQGCMPVNSILHKNHNALPDKLSPVVS